MATQNGIYETSSGDLLRAGFSTLIAGTGETLRTDIPVPGKVRWSQAFSNMHRWSESAWTEVAQPTTDIKIASFTPEIGKTYFCDTNAAAADIVVSNPTPNRMFDSYRIFLKTDHATRKLTANGNRLIIKNEWVDVVYDGVAWNNFTHLIACVRRATRNAAQSIASSSNVLIYFDAESFDNCSFVTTGTTPFSTRRAGRYRVTGGWVAAGFLDDNEYITAKINRDGGVKRQGRSFSPGTNNDVSAIETMTFDVAAGATFGLVARHIEGAAQNTDTNHIHRPFLEVEEILGA